MLTPFQNLRHRAKLLKAQARDKRRVCREVLMCFAVSGVGKDGEREHIGWYYWSPETKRELSNILKDVGSHGGMFKEDHQFVLWYTTPYELHSDVLPHEDVTELVRAINIGL